MIRHFVSDLDGTLLNGKYEWDEVIEKGVRAVLNHGCDFVVATGRTINGVKNCFGLWNIPAYLILMNGALVLNPQREVLFTKAVSLETKQILLTAYPNNNLEFITKDGTLTKLDRETFIKEYSAWDMWRKKVLEKKESGYFDEYLGQFSFESTDEEIKKAEILKINGLQLDDKEYAKMCKKVNSCLPDAINAPFADHVLEITDKEVSKAKALLTLSKLLGWKKEEIAVFGDGGNDKEMLKMFPHSYAPMNASEEVKGAASEIVEHHEQYGVVKKILELLNERELLH